MMEATRTRLSFTGEWIAVAALLAGTIVVGSLVVRELRVAPRAFSSGDSTVVSAPAIPPDAVSVPSLMLGPAARIAVGDPFEQVLAHLDVSLALVGTLRERGPL